VTGALQGSGDDGGAAARCGICGALAAGPCAGCRQPVCADCCVLTEGGAGTWAVCLACERRGGASLRRAWLGLLAWIGVPVLLLAGVAAAIWAALR